VDTGAEAVSDAGGAAGALEEHPEGIFEVFEEGEGLDITL